MSHDAFYFGCWGQSGHVMHSPRQDYVHHKEIQKTLPEKLRRQPDASEILDMGLVPKGRQIPGRALLHHIDGWTVLSFWDRSGDSRLNSNSSFILRGTHSFDEAIALARQHFPELFARFNFEIHLAPEDPHDQQA